MISVARSAGFLLVRFAGAQLHPEETPFAREYASLVDAYRDGSPEKPIEGVLALDYDQLEETVRNLVRHVRSDFEQGLDPGFFQAAATLHLDAAVRCWGEEQGDEATFQIEMARLLVDASEPADAGPGSFRRRWYAASALLVAAHLGPIDALKYFDLAVEAVPGDVPLLTAAGWFSERLSDGAAAPGASLRNSQALRRRHQRAAERYLAAAVDLDPRAEEPNLRLARIEALMGRDARAGGRLAALVARHDVQPFTAYLARLFLGGVRAREGETRQAERLLREAIALDPIAQSARIALAEMRYAAGDPAGAAEIVEPLATPPAGRDRNDPWADYRLAYPQVGALILDQLRDEVQR